MSFADPHANIDVLGLDPGAKVVDVGTGSGFYALLVAKRVGEYGKVYAVDVQKDLLSRLKTEAARQKLHNIETVWTDLDQVNSLKFADASMDAAIVSNVLFMLENRDNCVAEVMRVLKPKAKILFIDWKDRGAGSGLGPHQDQTLSVAKATALWHAHGARLLREYEAGAHHYGLLFMKNNE